MDFDIGCAAAQESDGSVIREWCCLIWIDIESTLVLLASDVANRPLAV